MVQYTVVTTALIQAGFIHKNLCPTKVEWRLGTLVFIQDLKNNSQNSSCTVSNTECEKTEDNLDTHKILFRRTDVNIPIGKRLTSQDLHF